MVEGKAMRMVEVTTHFTTPLTEEEKKSLPEKIRMVSDLVAVKGRAEGFGMWNIEAAIDTQVCQASTKSHFRIYRHNLDFNPDYAENARNSN